MPARKIAIALSEALLASVDEAARRRGESRGRYIARVLEVAVRTRRDAEITRKLDALFADEPTRKVQVQEARELDDGSTEWNGERW